MPLDPRLVTVLHRYEDLQREGTDVTLDQLCADHPGLLQEMHRFLVDELRHFPPTADEPTLPAPHFGTATAPRPSDSATRYQPLQPHAQGGLGEVWLAHDAELHRDVALKRIRPGAADHADSRRRFVLEAEVTGRLGHPGVVPVYGLVRDADGRPAYAMRFIEGETLQAAIDRFHGADRRLGRDPGERNIAFRDLLNRFLDVCNTIAFAHSRGVLHRDIKPANVMLGRFGETLVVDWGLAKEIGGPSTRGDAADEPSEASDSHVETRQGQVLGTPAFMSPEQAAGANDNLGPASDVYSLGSTLYTLLTGRLPFQGDSRAVVAQVQRGGFAPPRQVKREVPRPLEAVCLKAMALRPEDRYASALDLAADIRRFLADEPVAAWREPLTLRARRWLRRRRFHVAAAGVVIVVAALVFGMVQLAIAKTLAEEQRGRSERLFGFLSGGMERVYTEAVDEAAPRADTVDAFRDKLLETGLQVYADLAVDLGSEPSRQREAAAARFLVARIKHDLRHDDAATAYAQVLDEHRRLLAESEADMALRRRVAGLLRSYGGLLRQQGKEEAEDLLKEAAERYASLGEPDDRLAQARAERLLGMFLMGRRDRLDDARAAFLRARDLLDPLHARDRHDVRVRRDLGQTYNNLGVVCERLGKPADAVPAYLQAIDFRQSLAAQFPNDGDGRSDVARSWFNLGNARLALNQTSEASEAFESAYSLLEPHSRGSAEQRQQLANSTLNLGFIRRQRGDWPAAVRISTASVEACEMRAKLFPGPGNRGDLARALNLLAEWHRDLGAWDESRRLHQRALEIRTALARADATKAHLEYNRCDSLHNLGQMEHEAGRDARALELLRDAETALEKHVVQQPHDANTLARARTTLAWVLIAQGKPDEARTSAEKARAIREPLAKPNDVNGRRSLFFTYHALGVANRESGRAAEAVDVLTKARKIATELMALDPGRVDFRTDLTALLPDLGLALVTAGQKDEARKVSADAEAARDETERRFPGTALFHRYLRYVYPTLGRLQRELGQPEKAAATALRQRRLGLGRPEELIEASRELARCSRADDALDALREAAALAPLDLKPILEGPDWEPVRRHDEFGRFRTRVAAAARP